MPTSFLFQKREQLTRIYNKITDDDPKVDDDSIKDLYDVWSMICQVKKNSIDVVSTLDCLTLNK